MKSSAFPRYCLQLKWPWIGTRGLDNTYLLVRPISSLFPPCRNLSLGAYENCDCARFLKVSCCKKHRLFLNELSAKIFQTPRAARSMTARLFWICVLGE